ncbi:MAG: hypothetical protein OXR66_06790 [Candidatus Woesearchaeota archaeon]|nr:hypothetical protein [Candidatus Woesearchaeota archaeon]
MDEAVWAVIGILSAIITIAAVAGILMSNKTDLHSAQLESAVQLLAAQCDQVCSSPENTALSVKVPLPKNTILSTDAEKICATVADPICTRCACRHDPSGIILDLTEAFFDTHEFTCRYTRVDTGNTAQRVSVSCEG